MRRVFDFERVLAAFGADHASAAEVVGYGRGVQRCGHRQQPQIAAPGLLQAAQQGECEIAFETPLVEFVEHHATGAREGWVG